MRWAALVAVLVLVALPAVLSSYLLSVFIFIFFYAFLGQAWNIVGGYAGQLSAGHAAFVGIGAYASALLSQQVGLTPWLGMFVGGALAALLGAVIGYLGFRFGLRGFYFVLLTVAFAEVCRIAVGNLDVTGGAIGYYISFTGNPWQFQFRDNRAHYYITLALMLLATGVAWLIERRPPRGLPRGDPRGRGSGGGPRRERVSLQADRHGDLVLPDRHGRHVLRVLSVVAPAQLGVRDSPSVDIIIRPIVGGTGTLLGPILGSFILSPLAELSRHYLGQGGFAGAHLIAYGLLLIVVVLFLPQGAYPYLKSLVSARPRG